MKNDFESQKFASFQVLQSIHINFDETIIGLLFISEHISTPCSLFGPKLHNCNHATPYLLPIIVREKGNWQSLVSFMAGIRKIYDEVQASCSSLTGLSWLHFTSCLLDTKTISIALLYTYNNCYRPFILHALLKLSHVNFFPLDSFLLSTLGKWY